MLRLLTISTILACPAPLLAKDVAGMAIDLPSGARVLWQETRQDDSGGSGLTHRFRFVMPDLASRVPATTGPASEEQQVLERAPLDIDTETGDVEGDDGTVEFHLADLTPQDMDDTTEAQADAALDDPALPAAPDLLAQDPVHGDVVWLCENWALPRATSADPRPDQIVISLADRETAFGSYDPDALQLFEAFRLPPDRDACEWEPW